MVKEIASVVGCMVYGTGGKEESGEAEGKGEGGEGRGYGEKGQGWASCISDYDGREWGIHGGYGKGLEWVRHGTWCMIYLPSSVTQPLLLPSNENVLRALA